MRTRINIKTISVNEAWMGRRYKTKKYKVYEVILLNLLPKRYKVPKGKLEVYYKFGLSNKNADCDNNIKQFQDCLQKKYEFNDCMIYKLMAEKEDVKKGNEFVKFEIKKI